MAYSDLPQKRSEQHASASADESLGGSVSLFLRLWSYGGPSQPLSGLALEQDPEIAELIRAIIRDSNAVAAVQQTELLTARFDNPVQALAAAKALQQRFLTFQRKTEPQQVVPSILISATTHEEVSRSASAGGGAPENMLANVTSAQILVVASIYEQVKTTPGFKFNPKAVREAEQHGEAVYELLWTDESTYGHLRQASCAAIDTRGRYEIQEELGRGAMGAVYKAYDRIIKRTVALKTISINRNTPDRDDLIERLKQEARAAGGLDHPNIITIYDVGQEDDVVYLSMQFLEGKTLLSLLAEGELPSLPVLISWADQILSAVGYAHSRNVIHRDLKPANLMLTKQDVVKVLDFGIAKIENASLTQTGLVVGTPSYMAPEQVAGKKIDHRADIFALGSVFYELVTREKPFRGDVTTILYKIMNEEPVAPSIINPAIPGGIDAIIRKALAKDPKERFQTCEEMRDAFLEEAALLNVTPATGGARKAVAKFGPRSPVAIPRFLMQYSAQQSRGIWPTMAVVLLMAVAGVTGWAFYTKSQTGSFPPQVTRFVAAVERAWPQLVKIIKPEEPAAQQPSAGASDQTGQDNSGADSAGGTGPGTQGSRTPSNADSAEAAPEGAGSSGARLQETSAGQSGISQAGSEGARAPAATSVSSAPGQTQAPQSSNAAGQPAAAASPAGVQTGDKNQAAAEGAGATNPTADSAKAPVTSGADESQTTAPPSAARPFTRPRPEPVLTVDGFTRRDVPELLRQADAAVGRGDYRLARYEYQLILRLDPGNPTARAGMRRIQAADQAR